MKKFSFSILLLVVCAIVPVISHAYTFYRDLSEGDTGEDVRALQQMLNSDPQTRVANSGPGAVGQETTYFGTKTKAAVIRFQERNAEKILTPLGLFTGTGYVGSATRAALGSAAVVVVPALSPTPVVAPAEEIDPENFKGDPMISGLSREFTITSVKIILHGKGFTATGNEIHTNYGVFENTSSTNGTVLSFTVERSDTSLTAAAIDGILYVKNKNGKSAPIFFTLGM